MARLRCLVTGTDAIMVEHFAELLALCGHSAERVSPSEAFERAHTSPVDLVIIDSQDHVGLPRAIKNAAPSTRIILTTANPRLLSPDGVDVVLHKPLTPERIIEALTPENRV